MPALHNHKGRPLRQSFEQYFFLLIQLKDWLNLPTLWCVSVSLPAKKIPLFLPKLILCELKTFLNENTAISKNYSPATSAQTREQSCDYSDFNSQVFLFKQQ